MGAPRIRSTGSSGTIYPNVYYTVPQSINLEKDNPQYLVRTSSGGTDDGEIVASKPVMLYGANGGTQTVWHLGLLEIELPDALPTSTKAEITFISMWKVSINFYGTRWGTAPATIRNAKAIRYSTQQVGVNQGSTSLGNDGVEGQDAPFDIDFTSEAEMGVKTILVSQEHLDPKSKVPNCRWHPHWHVYVCLTRSRSRSAFALELQRNHWLNAIVSRGGNSHTEAC